MPEEDAFLNDHVYWNQSVPLRLRTAVVFQGGGIRGLFFPGHLAGLKKKGIEKVFLYAGTSAGALIAVGIWAGLSPEALREFLERKSRRCLAFALFSWMDLFEWAWTWAIAICGYILRVLLWPLEWFVRLCKGDRAYRLLPEMLPGCRGAKFERVINEIIVEGLKARGIHEDLVKELFQVDFKHFRPTFEEIWKIVEWVRLVNNVRSASDPDFEVITAAYPRLRSLAQEIRFDYLDRHGLPRNNILDLVYGRDTAHDPFFPPIFLATCCLEDEQPVIFNNIDRRFLQVPIAEIARATAGHPIVFRPKVLKVDGEKKKHYTDGGLMANFPVFSVHREFRRLLGPAASGSIPADFRPMTRVPFVTLGLSVFDQRLHPPSYLGLVVGLLTGGARAKLELELAQIAPYFRLLQQEVADQPHYLNFLWVTRKLIARTHDDAIDYVNKINLSTATILKEVQRKHILENLQAMMEVVEREFPTGKSGYVRAHLYLESHTIGLFEKKAIVSRGRSLRGFDDHKAQAREFAGMLGLVRQTGSPAIADAQLLQARRRANPDEPILNLRWEDIKNVPDDLNFCLIVPIFDFRTITYEPGTLEVERPGAEVDDCVRLFDTGIRGAIIGAISIDGAVERTFDGVEELAKRVSHSVLSTVERHAFEIGCVLSKEISGTLAGEMQVQAELAPAADAHDDVMRRESANA